MATASARQEWIAAWPMPLLGTLGIAGASTMAYASGVFMTAMTREFGWSRAQFSSAFTVQMLTGLLIGPLVGRVIDRVGPRRVALVGVIAFVPGLSVLGLASGSARQWWLLGAVQSLCTVMISPPTWIAAIAPRFHASRGLALAVALAGIGVGTAIWPMLAAYLVQHIGWRATFPALVLGWGAIMIPLTFRFFRDPPPARAAARAAAAAGAEPDVASPLSPARPDPQAFGRALRSRGFICIALAAGLYAGMSYAMILHTVPLLQGSGLSLSAAAALAGIIGICAIVGRLGTGLLLDRLPTRPIAVVVFMLPVCVSLLLRLGAGSWGASLLAVVLLGLSAGAETDVVVYIAARRFDRDVFASLFAVVFTLISLFAAAGPMLASVLFDTYGSYDVFLMLVIPVILVATVLMAMVLSPGRAAGLAAPRTPVRENA